MSLRYPITVQELEPGSGVKYFVCIPQLGSAAVNGIGDTLDEAMECLNSVKRDIFESFIENNVTIPEPEDDEDLNTHSMTIKIPTELMHYLFKSVVLSKIHIGDLISSVLRKHIRSEVELIKERNTKSTIGN